MAATWSSFGTAFLRNCMRHISGEKRLSWNVRSVLAENGIVFSTSFRGGSVWNARFNSSHKLLALSCEYSCSICTASIARVAAPSFPHWNGADIVQVLPGIKFEVSSNIGKPSLTTHGGLYIRRLGSQSTSLGQRGRPVILLTDANGCQKVLARISNIPKFVFKSDILWLTIGCNLMPEDISYVYDAKYRLKFIQIQLHSVETFLLAQRTLALNGRFGGRYLKLTSEDFMKDDVNRGLSPFRGRSLLMLKVPYAVVTEDVERFFSGFALDSNYSIKFLRSPVQVPVGGTQGSTPQMKTELEMRCIVRLRTELEALRAMREKQGAICLEKPIDLRFLF